MAGRITTLILAIAAAVLGLLLVCIGLLRAVLGEHDTQQFLFIAAAVPSGIMLLELGVATAWLTLRAARGEAAPAATVPPWWVGVLAFVAAVGAGWLTLRGGFWGLFLPFGTVAIFAPLATVASLGVPNRGTRPSWRRLLPAFAWGALVTPLLALTLQFLAAIGAIAAAVVGVMASGQEHLQTWQKVLQHLQGRTLTDGQAQALIQLVVRQPVVLAVGAFVLVIAGPATEELGKFGAVLLVGRARLPALTIFLIGLAAGLGFAATENIFYAAQAGPGGWAALVLTRGVTPLMHGTASALFAVGWARQRRNPAGWWLLRGAASALGLHASWNFCSGLLVVALLFVSAGGLAGALAIVLMILALGTLALLVIGCALALLHFRRTLAEEAALPEAALASSPAAVPGPARGSWPVPADVRVQHIGEAVAPVARAGPDRW